MLRINEDTAEITVYPNDFLGDLSRSTRELLTQQLASEARTIAIVLSRHTGVVWRVKVKPYTGL